jgi:hypothetical protein
VGDLRQRRVGRPRRAAHFAVVLQGGNRDIYVAPAEGGTVRRMNNESSDEGRPSFSMDGKWIYFRSNRSDKDEIWKMPRGGGAATQVTQAGGFEALETLDGKTLYFVHARTERGLWSMPAAGGAAEAVAGLESVSQGYVEMGLVGTEKAKPRRRSRWGSWKKRRLARWATLPVEPDRSSRCGPGAGGEFPVTEP